MILAMDILISGASVAGPALAYWLTRHGFDVTVVERSPGLRGGGYAVDFRGAAHLSVLTKMGILDSIKARQTHLSRITCVDRDGLPVAEMPAELFAGDVEILRGDLGEVLYEATRNDVKYLFGDTITGLRQRPDGVDVTFEHAAPRTFGLVIGADGLHSNVRRLAFGPATDAITDLGYFVSIYPIRDSFGLDRAGLIYSEPGRTASIFAQRDSGAAAIAMFYFRAPGLRHDHRDVAGQKKMLADAFAGAGWRVPELLAAMPDSRDFYFDSVSQVRLDRWSSGRVALVGDAACAAGPGGNGTGNAVVAAYVLAGEIARTAGYADAFAGYERLLRPYVAKGQKQALGGAGFLAPATEKKIRQRDRFYRMAPHLPVKGLIRYLSTRTATGIDLPDY